MTYKRAIILAVATVIYGLLPVQSANAFLIGFPSCTGANSCQIVSGAGIPNPVTPNPNNGILTTWNERQNVVLQDDLAVDRVADETASFIGGSAGNFFIKAGTIVTSHYLQWDPGNNSNSRVDARIELDSDIIAFITADQKLFDSDAPVGLPGIDYNDFNLRGLESGDTTDFDPDGLGLKFVDISWGASSPGDWTRLIAAFSPTVADRSVPEPGTLALFGIGLIGLGLARRRSGHFLG